ncbi:hypothetical protein EYF80_016921 [Liparis tanakae]|uniref:Uncharacterized protein n=1 Tax=Liparis tanakae TaxID=230148 RepID=A0A4Z2I4Q6_9TELE|nr:hypothetical protein EYF80_016921 [Liparis tanakae]
MILHDQAAPAQEEALTELSRETIQTVSLQFQLLGNYLDFVACNGKMLEVLQESSLQRYHRDGVVAHIEVPQLEEGEQR